MVTEVGWSVTEVGWSMTEGLLPASFLFCFPAGLCTSWVRCTEMRAALPPRKEPRQGPGAAFELSARMTAEPRQQQAPRDVPWVSYEQMQP